MVNKKPNKEIDWIEVGLIAAMALCLTTVLINRFSSSLEKK